MSDLLREAGEALYGPRWQVELARSLGVSDRTVRRWAAGSVEPPSEAYAEIGALCETRGADLKAMAKRLRKVTGS